MILPGISIVMLFELSLEEVTMLDTCGVRDATDDDFSVIFTTVEVYVSGLEDKMSFEEAESNSDIPGVDDVVFKMVDLP